MSARISAGTAVLRPPYGHRREHADPAILAAERGSPPLSAPCSLRFPRRPTPHKASDERGKSASRCRPRNQSRHREVTVCDGTFPDFATSLHGSTPVSGPIFPGRTIPDPSLPFGIMNRQPLSFQAATPSKSDPPPLKRRQESTIPNLGSRIAPPFPPTGRRVPPRTPVPGFTRPLGERLTSLPWSRPGSAPWRPSRGTGYG